MSEPTEINPPLTRTERRQIAEILKRRANDIAGYHMQHHRPHDREGGRELPGPVEFALHREMERLRRLAERVKPPEPPESDDD